MASDKESKNRGMVALVDEGACLDSFCDADFPLGMPFETSLSSDSGLLSVVQKKDGPCAPKVGSVCRRGVEAKDFVPASVCVPPRCLFYKRPYHARLLFMVHWRTACGGGAFVPMTLVCDTGAPMALYLTHAYVVARSPFLFFFSRWPPFSRASLFSTKCQHVCAAMQSGRGAAQSGSPAYRSRHSRSLWRRRSRRRKHARRERRACDRPDRPLRS